MKTTTVNWQDYLAPDEQILWEGRPEYGRNLWEALKRERVYHIGLLAIAITFMTVLPLFVVARGFGMSIPTLIFSGSVAVACIAGSYLAARSRAFIFDNLHYAVTDKRALVLRTNFNLLDTNQPFLTECPITDGYLFPIHGEDRFSSIQIGQMLAPFYQKPFTGTGLSHVGRDPYDVERVFPILFENILDATHVQAVLRQAAAKSSS